MGLLIQKNKNSDIAEERGYRTAKEVSVIKLPIIVGAFRVRLLYV